MIATIPIGQQPQALVYVPDAVPEGDGTANLTPLAQAGDAVHLTLIAPTSGPGKAHATVSVNSIGPLDLLEAAVSGLVLGKMYTLWITPSLSAPSTERTPLADFKTNLSGAQVVQAIAPLRKVLDQAHNDTIERGEQRFLLITETDNSSPVLVQSEIQR